MDILNNLRKLPLDQIANELLGTMGRQPAGQRPEWRATIRPWMRPLKDVQALARNRRPAMRRAGRRCWKPWAPRAQYSGKPRSRGAADGRSHQYLGGTGGGGSFHPRLERPFGPSSRISAVWQRRTRTWSKEMNDRLLMAARAALLSGILALTGCAGSESVRYYVLSATPAGPVGAAVRDIPVGVGPVELPEYLDRPQIVTRTSQNELNVADFDRWAESLATIRSGCWPKIWRCCCQASGCPYTPGSERRRSTIRSPSRLAGSTGWKMGKACSPYDGACSTVVAESCCRGHRPTGDSDRIGLRGDGGCHEPESGSIQSRCRIKD